MKVTDAITRRMSVRAFRPEAPPAATVRGILETAARAPSGGNLQPWRVHALTGTPLAELLAELDQVRALQADAAPGPGSTRQAARG